MAADRDGPNWEDRVIDAIEDPERRAHFLRWAWWISLLFTLFGFVIIFLVLTGYIDVA